MRIKYLPLLLTFCVALCANAQAPSALVVPPEKSQPITIPKFEKPPTIDGKLDEEVWQKAAVLKDFYQIQPGDNTPPSKPTEVLIGFDPKFLYIAFKATDEPDKIRATVAKRDNIWQDDYVGFMLDTFNDKRNPGGRRLYWSVEEWQFFLDDVVDHQLRRPGTLFVALTKERLGRLMGVDRLGYNRQVLTAAARSGATVNRRLGTIKLSLS